MHSVDMRNVRGLLCLAAVLMFWGPGVRSADYYVNAASGDDAYDGLAPEFDGVHGPKATIQAAIDAAASGDVVHAAEGTYYECINFNGKDLTLTGPDPDDSSAVENTIIDGGGSYECAVVTFSSGETTAAVIEGFTLRNGAGGVYCSGASPTIRKNRIVNNSSMWDGGGLQLYDSQAVVEHVVAAGNYASNYGGGAVVSGGGPVFENVTFRGNNAYSGGGLFVTGGATVTLRNAILWSDAESGGGGAELGLDSGSLTVEYSDVQGGEWGVLNAGGQLTWGSGNIDADPLFADAANGDYHLRSEWGRWDSGAGAWVTDDATTPCLDAGAPDSDYSQETAPNGGRINMGAYGGTPEASRSQGEVHIVVEPDAVTVPEGGQATFTVRLDNRPSQDVTVTVSRYSGDADISVASGGTLVFTPDDWDAPQTVTLSAAEDDDDVEAGTAVIRCSAPDLDPADVTATESDNDAALTVAGGTPEGTTIHPLGSVVTITATPPDHYHFTQWTGDTADVADVNAAQTTITMNADASVTAESAIDQHLLTIDSPRGDPQGGGWYDYGSTAHWSVTSPVPADDEDHVWTADPSEGDVVMDADKTVTVSWTLVELPPAGEDADGDGLEDRWEVRWFGHTNYGPDDDPDVDGLNNSSEQTRGTIPSDADSNGDGLSDGASVALGSDPTAAGPTLRITQPADGSRLP